MKKKVIIAAVIVVVATVAVLLGRGMFTGEKNANAMASAGVNKTAVKVLTASTVEKSSKMSYKATLEASEEGIVSSKVGKQVAEILFDNGQAVSKGQVLVKLDSKEAEVNLLLAQAQLENAQRSYDRNKTLYEQGSISKSEFEGIEYNYKLYQANLEVQKYAVENNVITSPISGVIDEKSVSPGQYLNPGSELAKVKAIAPITAVIEVGQSDVALIKKGQKAFLKLENSDKAYEGTVKSIDVSANTETRVFKCKVQFGNNDLTLKPGIFAKVEIPSDQKIQAIMLPMGVLTGTEGSYFVFVNENGIAKKRSVAIGEITKDMVEIKSGIQNGDQVITTNISSIQDGDAVNAVAQ